jgi:predicted Fe-S protein YdhL (DUF1289 family)
MSIHLLQQHVLVVLVKSTSNVPSPCVKVCSIEEGYCIGCGRSQDEIREWFYCDDDRKLEILAYRLLEKIVNV